ncbi:MAG: helix-turn-helix transcriptional regulator [Clostridia bacterium]|nr:AraC family transcriptional regulator [Oscillospiraceae bacterium]MBQ7032711.1 helix-turn-helix transcriptional regulator [Clostridia bacterium]
MPYSLRRAFSVLSLYSAFAEDRALDFYFKGEMHDFWEVVYVASGKIGVTEDERVYEMEKGDIIFHRPMEFHKVWSLGTKKPHVFTMSFKTEGEVPAAIGDGIIHLNPLEESTYKSIFSLAEALMHKLSSRSPVSEQNFTSALESFIIHLAVENAADPTLLESPDALRYRKIIEVMQANLSQNLSVSDIARLCHMAPSTMKNAFIKFSDCGVRKHFVRLKLAAALPLLQKGLSVADISEQLAFSSQNYFAMVFKAEMGLSPLEYKRKYLS